MERANFTGGTVSADMGAEAVFATLDALGCVVVKGALSVEHIGRLARRAVARYDDLETYLRTKTPYPAPQEFIYRPTNHAMSIAALYSDKMIPALPMPAPMVELFRESWITPIMSRYLGGSGIWLWDDACTTRKMNPDEKIAGSEQKLPLHADGSTANIPELGDALLVASVPLTAFDWHSPRIEVFVPRAKELPQVNIDQNKLGFYSSMEVSEEAMRQRFPGIKPWAPELQLGDILLFDKYTLHRTYFSSSMTKTRYSMDIRFFGSDERATSGTRLTKL